MLAQQYDPAVIAALTRGWTATHAVGGTLVAARGKYTGTLRVFGPDGRVAFAADYAAPRTFFDLLGDMDVDAMTFFREPPNRQLDDFLHQPRVAHPKSLARLGLAMFQHERGPAEFELYEQILRDDPDFAEVRHWAANQKHWDDQDDRADQLQKAIALRARVAPLPLVDLDPDHCPDRALAARYPTWIDRVADLGGATRRSPSPSASPATRTNNLPPTTSSPAPPPPPPATPTTRA